MIPIRIIAVSKTPRGPFLELQETYQKHLKGFARLELIEVKPEPFSSIADRERVRRAEAERVKKSIPDQALVVALDERGKEMPSLEFSEFVGKAEDQGQTLCFVIGGPLGLDPSLRAETDKQLSLSKLTLPHDLAKTVLLEQLYRAFTLLRGKTYHY